MPEALQGHIQLFWSMWVQILQETLQETLLQPNLPACMLVSPVDDAFL